MFPAWEPTRGQGEGVRSSYMGVPPLRWGITRCPPIHLTGPRASGGIGDAPELQTVSFGMTNMDHLPPLKGRFPFRLGTTSYIIPDAILPNIRFLGPYLDEVELVLFDSGREENLPSHGEIEEMAHLGEEMELTYNVHLPADIFLGDPDPKVREQAVVTAIRFYQRTVPLSPTAFVLHLDSRGADGHEVRNMEGWIGWLRGSMVRLAREGMDLRRVAVENLDYPLDTISPLVAEFGMSFCLDTGHLLRYGFDLRTYLESFLPQTSMIHLHGVVDGADHRGAHGIYPVEWRAISEALAGYRGGVSLEVFSLQDLSSSMDRLWETLNRVP